MAEINTIAVIGAGIMGRGIAHVAALGGYRTILEDLDRVVLPGVTHWNHPRFFGYFGLTGSLPGIAGELIAAALNTNHMLWRSSPAGGELEEVAARWLAQLLGLPEWYGLINDTEYAEKRRAILEAV